MLHFFPRSFLLCSRFARTRTHPGRFWKKTCQLVPRVLGNSPSSVNYCSINLPVRKKMKQKSSLKERRDLHPSWDEKWRGRKEEKKKKKNGGRQVSLTIIVALEALELVFTFHTEREREKIYFLDMTHWVESHTISWMCYCYFEWRWKCWTFHIQWDLLCVTAGEKGEEERRKKRLLKCYMCTFCSIHLGNYANVVRVAFIRKQIHEQMLLSLESQWRLCKITRARTTCWVTSSSKERETERESKLQQM